MSERKLQQDRTVAQAKRLAQPDTTTTYRLCRATISRALRKE